MVDQPNLFDSLDGGALQRIAPGAIHLHGFALPQEQALLADIEAVVSRAPLRHMRTPGGQRLSAAMTNCGDLGWVTDRRGYRYSPTDPESGEQWPSLPRSFQVLAETAATQAGFAGFHPDACLINQYGPGDRMGLHQDKDEHDLTAPIVSVSLGLPAVFLLGGPHRSAKALRIPLRHGDVVVWGGPARMRFHGIAPLQQGSHPSLGPLRLNLTMRRAGVAPQ